MLYAFVNKLPKIVPKDSK